MIEEIGIRNIYGQKSFVYKIYLEQSYIFMRIDKTPHYNAERYVVIVDTHNFYKTWTGNSIDQCNIYNDWELKKYYEAIDGFSKGIENPVPLAVVGYSNEIAFTNGITRTKWLIINRARCFPLECNRRSAKLFHERLSYADEKIRNVFRLFKE